MEKRVDRWKEFSKQIGVPPNVKRFIAVDGSTLDIMNDDRIPLNTKRNILKKTRRAHEEISTVGAIGCALSHISIWEWALQNQAPVTLVMEDDAKVPVNFVPLLNQIIANSPILQDPKQWDLMNLSDRRSEPIPVKADPSIVEIEGFVGTQCYLITLDCAKQFLKEAYSLHLHIDLWMAVYRQVHGLKLIALPTLTVGQRSSKTDIQERLHCKICDINPTYYKTHQLIRNEEFWLAKAMEIALIVTFLYMGYRFITRKD